MPAIATPEQASAFVAQYDVVDPPHIFQIPVPEPKPDAPAKAATPVANEVAVPPLVATVATPVQPEKPAGSEGSPAPVVQPAPSTPAAHPEWLTKEATAIGIPAYMQAHLPTEVLSQAVMEKLRTAPVAPGAAPTAPGAAVVAPVAPAPPPFNWGTFDETDAAGRVVAKKTYTDADIDPAIAAHIKLLHQEIANLKQFQSGVVATVATTQEQQITQVFDAAFNSVPQVFGAGGAKDVKDKPEYARRQAVYNAVKSMIQALPEGLKGSITIPQAIAIQAKALFNVDIPKAGGAPANGQPTAQQFQNGQVAHPTQKKAATPTPGRDVAIGAATEWWKENVTNNAGTPQSGDTQISEFF